MGIPSKNHNQSSVPVKVFNSDTVKDHVSVNNKDIGIPNKKDVDIHTKNRC